MGHGRREELVGKEAPAFDGTPLGHVSNRPHLDGFLGQAGGIFA